MLENSIGLNFFMKTPEKKTDIRYIYLRITVDGIRKETSTKQKWDVNRWEQRTERAIGTKEDARTLNHYLDTLTSKVKQYATELLYGKKPITTKKLMDFVNGKIAPKIKVLEEFAQHNAELLALVDKKEYAIGTYKRFATAKSHVHEFLKYKYQVDDIDFAELNYEFVKDYEFYLKTVKNCNNNTAIKYISNFKKIVIRGVDKEIIAADPFLRFKSKKTKTNKKPLPADELYKLEYHDFSTSRLELVRDIFVFQCYTGLAYIDAFQLKPSDIKRGILGVWLTQAGMQHLHLHPLPAIPCRARHLVLLPNQLLQ